MLAIEATARGLEPEVTLRLEEISATEADLFSETSIVLNVLAVAVTSFVVMLGIDWYKVASD
jgi:NADH:ubiquinone oxidoreductase subunit F (NADH-binding)